MHNNLEIKKNWLELKRNCDYYFSRLLDYPLCPPEHIYFCLTSRCNLKCKMCTVSRLPSKKKDELNTEECRKIIDQIVDLNINHLIFSGGEPLLRKDIFNLITYAVDKKIKMVDVISNGTLFDENIIHRLVKCGVNHITISIDGMEETNDFIRGRGSFQKAIEAIELVNKYKNRDFPTVGINFTIMDCNISQILSMIKLAQEKKCNTIVLQPMLCDNIDMQKREQNELWVSQKNIASLKEIIEEVIKLKKTIKNLSIHVNEQILKRITTYFLNLPLDTNLKCYEGIVRIAVSHNGDLWTCRGIYGNLKKDSLRRSWISPEIKKIRAEIKKCQNHCLQSCIYLEELSDIYFDAKKFQNLINKIEEKEEYAKRSLVLFKSYNFLLERKLIKYLKSESEENEDNYLNELKSEIAKTSEIIKNLVY